jgi:hypothetical protein
MHTATPIDGTKKSAGRLGRAPLPIGICGAIIT